MRNTHLYLWCSGLKIEENLVNDSEDEAGRMAVTRHCDWGLKISCGEKSSILINDIKTITTSTTFACWKKIIR
ncbi:CLUMA_CG000482, isoform A [Clunio marinus]|uniref:CLUMA_CG000482, isoform A n=1 Tax=Clunio marinus TaxID=568069 RepID=A0A1J1HJJ9_9DIPT|nr:CLUMA_CG000482, isoform A [Clunio marinus]